MEPRAVEVDGEEPALVGQACRELLVEEYWHVARLVDAANVVWLLTESGWHRLFFDCGVVFWRRSDRGPAAYEVPELNGRIRLADLGRTLGLVGRGIAGTVTRLVDRGVEVALAFDGGSVLRFRCVKDQTVWACTGEEDRASEGWRGD